MTRHQRIRRAPRGRRPWTTTAFTLLTAFLLLAVPFPAAAHPPSALVLSYDAAAQTLTIEITHASQSPGTHFIKMVEVTRDGKTLPPTEYKSQPNQATFSYTYPLDNPGDVVEVKASCSIFGSRSETMRMRKELR
jgi:hypothetical protein